MTVMTRARTTIGQLVYDTEPAVDFPRLVADLEVALAGSEGGKRRLTFHGDRIAFIDAGSSRVTVAFATDLDEKGGAAVLVTVGYAPIMDGDLRLARRRSVLARLIAERVAERFPPADTVWTETEDEATPDLVSRLIERLTADRQSLLETRNARAREKRASPRHFVEPDDLPRMVARIDAALAARRAGRPGRAALAGGGTVQLDISDLAALDRATEAANRAGTPSAPMRLAAHMIDATLMVVALPVGAAMMIYSLSRGANLNTSARAMALSGIGIAIVQKVGAAGILGSIFTRGI
jgi:hypothetical protein